jgi:Reverse transcriptase (RNA-dependent DNA polymerase)
VRGLRSSTGSFSLNVLNNDYDIVCLTETWLSQNFNNSELFDSNYNVFRRDRDRPGSSVGGGVLVATKCRLSAQRRDWRSSPASEEIWITVEISKGKFIHIVCAYFPHNFLHSSLLSSFFDFTAELIFKYPNDVFILTGDFNISYANWLPRAGSDCIDNELLINHNNDSLAMLLADFISFTNVKQFNNIHNHNNRILDLILSNSPCILKCCDYPLTRVDLNHPALVFDLPISSSMSFINPSLSNFNFNFHLCNFSSLNEAISSHDWSCLNDMNTEDSISYFYSILYSLFENLIPKKRPFTKKFPSWYSRELIRLCRKKKKIHSKWKLYGLSSDYDKFSVLRLKHKSLLKNCYSDYIKNVELNIKINPKSFWNYVQSKSPSNQIPDTMYLDSVSSSDGFSISNLFNNYFSSVFESNTKKNSSDYSPYSFRPLDSSVISSIEIDYVLVSKLFKEVNVVSGPGSDGVHPLILSRCHNTLAVPLTTIFHKSLNEGCFPKIWKNSYVSPIFKSGKKNNIKNYRPISKPPIFGKILEKIVAQQLTASFASQLLTLANHGFVRGRSINTNLISYTDFIHSAIDAGYQVDAIYTDFSKAFDKLDHNLLISKLSQLGIFGNLLIWLKSFVQDRRQAVVIKGFTSDFCDISSGVPQGTHLGPLLFILYLFDIDVVFKSSNHLLYADDTKFFKLIKQESDCIDLQSDIDRFSKYCTKNNLTLNIDKCHSITFHRNINPILFSYKFNSICVSRVFEVRDLGIILDYKLDFIKHIDSITSRAFRRLGFILRISIPFKNHCSLLILYFSLVRSIIEFGTVVWSPQYKIHITRIERIQKKLCKHLCYRFGIPSSNYDFFLQRFNIPSLASRRIYLDILFLYKILNNYIDSLSLLPNIGFKVPRLESRSHVTFHIDFSRTNYMSHSFFKRSMSFYNNSLCHLDIFNSSLSQFKKDVAVVLYFTEL